MRCLSACLLIFISAQVSAGSPLTRLQELQPSALLVQDSQGQTLYEKNPDVKLTPASTIKLLTALIALQRWGASHRFNTGFYLDRPNNILMVKGLGDPFLVSEEIDLIVKRIKSLGIKALDGISADSGFFAGDITISGQGRSNNPYDASPSALAANFNTIQVKVTHQGLFSAEQQTPLTPLARRLAKNLDAGIHRINLGGQARAPAYFIELLTAKLKAADVTVRSQQAVLKPGRSPELLFIHANSRTLAEVVAAMLKYSNNFIANQLFLLLGADKSGAPANTQKARQAFTAFIESELQWRGYQLFDGAGLSRKNRLSARQLIEVIERFSKYRALMPRQNARILAKSGTLSGVSAYAGYLYKDSSWLRFALIINQPVEYGFKERLARHLLDYPPVN